MATKGDIAHMATKDDLREVLAPIQIVAERVSTVQHSTIRVSDSLVLEKLVDALEAKHKEVLEKH
jgi:hypothetical protein